MKSVLAVALLLVVTQAGAAGIYKCVTAGKTSYQDRPCAVGDESKPGLVATSGDSAAGEYVRAENEARYQQAKAAVAAYEQEMKEQRLDQRAILSRPVIIIKRGR